MFIETDSQYGTGFEISEYKGKISLVAAYCDDCMIALVTEV